MADIIKPITLELVGGFTQIVDLMFQQGDAYTRKIDVSLTQNGVPYIIPVDSIISIQMLKKEHEAINNPCQLIDNKIRVTVTPQMTAVAGRIPSQIKILFPEAMGGFKTVKFHMNITRGVVPDDFYASVSQFGVLDALTLQAYDMLNELANLTDSVSDVTADAIAITNSATQAEAIRVTSETERITNENIRKSNENARNVYEVYDNSKPYVVNNKVTYNGSSYVNKLACTGILPTNTTYWLLIADKGTDGGTWTNAVQLPITDTGNFYTTDNVNAALQEVGANLVDYDSQLADIAKVMNSGAENKLINADFNNGVTGWRSSNSVIAATSDTLSIIGTGTNALAISSQLFNFNSAHKYYISAKVLVTNSEAQSIAMGHYTGQGYEQIDLPLANTWYELRTVKSGYTGDAFIIYHYYATAAITKDKIMKVKDVIIYDLTEIFESGIEPTKEQMYAMLQYYPKAIKLKQDKSKVINNLTSYFYAPRTIPATDGTGDINAETVKSSDVYTLYDNLITKYPDYITKTLLGNNQGGTIPIYKYVFAPSAYAKTIIAGANIHGGGDGGDPKDDAIALYYFMKDICENWSNDKKLAELRFNTQIVIMPIQNPWGFDNDNRCNARGVDLNRNFDWHWSEFTTLTPFQAGYKGTAPFSEAESQIIKTVLTTYTNAVAYIDFHAFSATNVGFGYNYVSSSTSKMNSVADILTKHLITKYTTARNMDTTGSYNSYPTAYNYAEQVIRIPSSNPEYIIFRNDGLTRSSFAITQMVEWFGNLIYLMVTRSESVKYEKRLSLLQSNASMIASEAGTVLKQFTEQRTANPFIFNSSTGEITIPFGVKNIRLDVQTDFIFNSTTAETFKISINIRKNSARLAGYPLHVNYLTLGGDASYKREYICHTQSPVIAVTGGDVFLVTVNTTHAGGLLSTNSSVLEGTWIGIEEIIV